MLGWWGNPVFVISEKVAISGSELGENGAGERSFFSQVGWGCFDKLTGAE